MSVGKVRKVTETEVGWGHAKPDGQVGSGR